MRSASSRRPRLLVAALTAGATGLLGPAALPADAAAPATDVSASPLSLASRAAVTVPGNLTGLGFDTCSAPDQATMDTLRVDSPYWGVGVYIGGAERTCAQPNLTASWVRTQASRGWHVFPVWAGLQSPCSDVPFDHHIARDNDRARAQGRQAANHAVSAASGLAMAKGSTLFLDVEPYDNTTSRCNQPVLHYQSGWSQRLHALGWKSGFYSAASSGIASLDYVRATFPGYYEMPNAVWFARDNGKATTDGDPYLRDRFWRTQRIHQYRLDVWEQHGSTRIKLDRNAIAIGRGSRPGKVRGNCGGVRLNFDRYRFLGRGAKGAQVKAAQCQLRRHGFYDGALTGTLNRATARAIGRLQNTRDLRVTRTMNAPTWTALWSTGSRPLVKRGSANDRVRFLQRALTAALATKVAPTGVVNAGTATAIRRYQRDVGVDANGVVLGSTWRALQSGRR
jgi:hypothetical protein